MIGLDGEKMSKSKGNLVFVSRLVSAGVDPMAIRWALMTHHYRSDRMWNEAVLQTSQTEIVQLRNALARAECAPTADLIELIVSALSDDLNTPLVVSALNNWSGLTLSGESGGKSSDLKIALDALLGLKF